MSFPIDDSTRLSVYGTLANVTVGDLIRYIESRQSTPAPATAGVDAAIKQLQEDTATVAALAGHGPQAG